MGMCALMHDRCGVCQAFLSQARCHVAAPHGFGGVLMGGSAVLTLIAFGFHGMILHCGLG